MFAEHQSSHAGTDVRIPELVRAIHASGAKACIVVTGTGTQAIAWLFAEPGASRTVLDAQVPYSSAALDEYVGGPAEQHVSATEAVRMAQAARARAGKLAALSKLDRPALLVGVGCTGAIVTDRVRRGEDRVHVAWTDGRTSKAYSLVFAKEARDRRGEEYTSSALVLNALAQACGLVARLPLNLLPGEMVIESE